MAYRIAHFNVWVHDQDEALEWYTKKLGFEVRADVSLPELGGYRWLTVGPVGQPEVDVTLNIPGPPVHSPEETEQVKELTARGVLGGVMLETDDCQAAYEELSSRGVEFFEPPSERPYGVDAGFRDPFGNSFRLTQPTPIEQLVNR